MKKNILMVGVAATVGLATFTLLPAQEPSPGGPYRQAEEFHWLRQYQHTGEREPGDGCAVCCRRSDGNHPNAGGR